jgi:alcohol dehydrogenase
MSNQIILPRMLQIGAGASQQITDVLASINCHRLIGAFFHVPHGLSNAMLLPSVTQCYPVLPSVTEFSISAAPKRYTDFARAIWF